MGGVGKFKSVEKRVVRLHFESAAEVERRIEAVLPEVSAVIKSQNDKNRN